MKGSSSLSSCRLSISLRFTSCRLLCPKLTDAPYSGPGACPLPFPKWRLHSQGPHTLPSQGTTQLYKHNRWQSFRQLQHSLCTMNIERIVQLMSNSLAFCFPSLSSPFAPLCSLLPTWNPPCCDRIRPPQSQVARKLISPFPHSTHIPLIPKSGPPGVSQN